MAAAALLLAASQAQANIEESMFAAAQAVDAAVVWQRGSVVTGDFSCRGRREFALLGTTPTDIVVGVFEVSSGVPIEVLRFPGKERSARTAVLASETLNVDMKEAAKEIGYLPDGLQRSSTCLGLRLSDDQVDAAHIYWHRQRKRFMTWSL